MIEPDENRASVWFTPVRFGFLLALLIFAAFPQVLLGMETFVARDYGFFVYPLAYFQHACFWHGELPFWNPYNNCGVPFLAQWNTMPLYPPALIYLVLPLTWGLGFFALLHLWFAGMGMFFLARRWTGNSFAAAFAGTIFAFNGFSLNLLMWPSHLATFSWMPWVIFALEAAWREGGRKVIWAAMAGALQMLAGGPEIIFLTWCIATVLWLQQLIQGELPRPAMFYRFPLVVALVVALSVAQLLPFLDLVHHAQRASGFADLRWSMPGSGWANFLVPMAFGTSGMEGLFFQHGQYWTSSYYLGIGVLWLALLSTIATQNNESKSKKWLLAAIAVAGLIFALGENTPVLPALRKMLPQLSMITYPIKYICVTIFALPLLAAFGIANFVSAKKQLLPIALLLLALIAGIVIWTQYGSQPGDAIHGALLNGISRAVFLILTGAILFALARNGNSKFVRWMPLFLILVAWADVFTHEPKQNPTVSPVVFEPNLARADLQMNPQPELGGSRAMLSPAAAVQLTRYAAADPKVNFLAKRAGYCANVNLLDAVPKVDGFFSLTPREFDLLLSSIYSATNGIWSQLEDFIGVAQTTSATNMLVWQSRATYLPLVTAGQKPVFLDDTNAIWALGRNEIDTKSIVFLPPEEKSLTTVSSQTGAKILESKFGNNTVDFTVEADVSSLAVIAQSYYHNWRAEVDGQPAPLLRANTAFQAVQVPSGKHHVHLFYHDTAFEAGAIVSTTAWIGCLAALPTMRPRRKNP